MAASFSASHLMRPLSEKPYDIRHLLVGLSHKAISVELEGTCLMLTMIEKETPKLCSMLQSRRSSCLYPN